MDFLLEREKSLFEDDFLDLINNEFLSVEVTYQNKDTEGTFARATGKRIPTFVNKLVRTFRTPLSEREVNESGGQYQIGDYRYLINKDDISVPTKDDRIKDGNDTRYMVNFDADPVGSGIFWAMIFRNQGPNA